MTTPVAMRAGGQSLNFRRQQRDSTEEKGTQVNTVVKIATSPAAFTRLFPWKRASESNGDTRLKARKRVASAVVVLLPWSGRRWWRVVVDGLLRALVEAEHGRDQESVDVVQFARRRSQAVQRQLVRRWWRVVVPGACVFFTVLFQVVETKRCWRDVSTGHVLVGHTSSSVGSCKSHLLVVGSLLE